MAVKMPQACERCWRRKQKCSRDSPTCLQCCAVSTTCVRRRFTSALNDCGSGSGTGIEALKSRIQSMRSRLESNSIHSPQTDQQPITPQSRIVPDSDISQSSRISTVASREVHQESQDINDRMQVNVAYLSLSAMAERTDGEPFVADGLSYMTLLYAATGVSGANPTLSVTPNEFLTGSLAEFRRSGSLNVDFGGVEMRAAFQKYVEMIKLNFPFMSSSELSENYESMVQHAQEGDFESRRPELVALVYLGTATGLLLSTHYTHKEMFSAELVFRAVRLMPQIFQCSSQMPAIHCLTALCIFSIFTAFGGSTWHLLGLLMSRCVSAGIHAARPQNQYFNVQDEEQSHRELWTIYILETYVSATLDRPFCLNDRDIVISAPPSPPSRQMEMDSERAIFHHLIQHAKMIRFIRQTDPGTGLLCHYINIRHWSENMPKGSSSIENSKVTLLARGFVEILKQPLFFLNPDRHSMLNEIVQDLYRFLDLLETQLNSQAGAVASIDALIVFAIGVIFAKYNTSLPDSPRAAATLLDTGSKLLQITNILALFAARHAPIRGLRDIISALQQQPALGSEFQQQHLRGLVAKSELVIPRELQTLLFEEERGYPIVVHLQS